MSNSIANLFFSGIENKWANVNFMIVSAENPDGKQLPDWQNEARHADLRRFLDASVFKHSYVETTGHYGDCDEKGFLIAVRNNPVANYSFDDLAKHVGKVYGQESVLTKNGLLFVYTDGQYPIAGCREVDAIELDHDWSEVDGRKFIIDLELTT